MMMMQEERPDIVILDWMLPGISGIEVCRQLRTFSQAFVPVLAASKAFALGCTLDDALAQRDELAFMQAVKVILTKRDITAQKKTDEQREAAIRQIIGQAVVSESVVDIFDAVGLDKPNIGLLDDGFLAQVKNLPERNLAVELLERLLEGEIKSKFATNVVQQKKFSDLLSSVITRYQNRSIETAQVMEELVEMAKKFKADAGYPNGEGFPDIEIWFREEGGYNAAILVGPDGTILGRYRKVHLPGSERARPAQRYQQLEKRYFAYGDLGFPAFRTPAPIGPGIMGMLICNDRRWPEAWRVLGLQQVDPVVMRVEGQEGAALPAARGGAPA